MLNSDELMLTLIAVSGIPVIWYDVSRELNQSVNIEFEARTSVLFDICVWQ